MKKETKKLGVKDFITIGIFTAILFVVEFACAMLGYIHPIMVAALSVLIPLVGGIPMMLFYTKVERFGKITIMSVLVAIIMFATGMGYLGAPLILISGVVADLIAASGKYKSVRKSVVSYAVFCLWICANYFPVVITADSYRNDLVEAGYSAEYCNILFAVVNYKTIAILVAVCFIFGCIGALIGKAAVKKHFAKAGIA